MAIRQFKQEDIHCIIPEKYDALNLSVPKLLTDLDKVIRRMITEHTNRLMPECRHISEDDRIRLVIEYVKQRPDKKNKEMSVIDKENMRKSMCEKECGEDELSNMSSILLKTQSQRNDDYYFTRSVNYFAEGEQRPKSRIFEKNPK